MDYWQRRAANPNTFRRTVQTERIPHLEFRRQGSVQAAEEANEAHAALVDSEEARQGKKHLASLKAALDLVLASGDKRRRPRGVSKELFKEVRKLKLTRTTKIRRTRKK